MSASADARKRAGRRCILDPDDQSIVIALDIEHGPTGFQYARRRVRLRAARAWQKSVQPEAMSAKAKRR